MRTVRCLLRPAASAWLLCSMGTVLADEGVARTSDLRPAVGVASTTALRASQQEASAATAPEAAPPAAKPAPAEPAGTQAKSHAKTCGEGGCGDDGCGEEGCNGHNAKNSGLLGRLFGSKGSAAGGKSGKLRGGAGSGQQGAQSGASGHAGAGHAGGQNGAGAAGGAAAGAGAAHSGAHGAAAGHGAAGSASGGHGAAAGGQNGAAGAAGGGHGLSGQADAVLNGHGNGPHGSLYSPSSPGHWFGGQGAAVCHNCQCNPCRCNGGYGPGFVDYGDRVFSCLFGWALPSGACGQGLPLVGKYHMVYADQPGYVNPADTRLYSAQGYGMPMTVPLAPTVNYQYNYSSGIPASRITPIGTWNPITSPQALPHQSW
ncbi:MAG: hypothetical protein ACKOEO_21870 [Planctomycetaceae bacterium]